MGKNVEVLFIVVVVIVIVVVHFSFKELRTTSLPFYPVNNAVK